MYSEAIIYSSLVSHTKICIFFFFSPGLENRIQREIERESGRKAKRDKRELTFG